MLKVNEKPVQINKSKLLKAFDMYSCHTRGHPDKTELNDLMFHIEKRYYEQLIYRFPENYITVVLKYFEAQEKYEVCGIMKRVIEYHNKINSDNIKTNLDECK